MHLLRTISLGFALLLSAAAPATSSEPKSTYPGFKKIKYIFSFGDSYTQTGFNLTNGSPLPAPGNPMGNPAWPGLTSSNGPNWIGYLTTTYNESEVLTYNLAYGGATIDSALVKPYREDVLSMKSQVENLFLPLLTKPSTSAPHWKGKNSLFTFWIGINDIGNSYKNGNYDTFHNTLMDTYFGLVEKLYAAGARNFLFINVPPIDRSPSTVSQGKNAVEMEAKALASYNAKLVKRAQKLVRAKGKQVWSKVFDSAKLFNFILDNPTPFRISNTTAFCAAYQIGTPEMDTFRPECGVPVNEYFWLNSLHPGYRVHDAMAKKLAMHL